MSNIRGLIPILLATGLGVANGVLVFGPGLKEQKEERDQMQQALEAARQSESNEAALRDAEAAASRTIATKSALKANPSVKSWWSGLSLWSKETNTTTGQPRDALHIEDSGTKKGDR